MHWPLLELQIYKRFKDHSSPKRKKPKLYRERKGQWNWRNLWFLAPKWPPGPWDYLGICLCCWTRKCKHEWDWMFCNSFNLSELQLAQWRYSILGSKKTIQTGGVLKLFGIKIYSQSLPNRLNNIDVTLFYSIFYDSN